MAKKKKKKATANITAARAAGRLRGLEVRRSQEIEKATGKGEPVGRAPGRRGVTTEQAKSTKRRVDGVVTFGAPTAAEKKKRR